MFFFQEEQPIFDAFSQEDFTSKFISFLSLEDRKGKDKFNVHRFVLFKVRPLDPNASGNKGIRKVQGSQFPMFWSGLLSGG